MSVFFTKFNSWLEKKSNENFCFSGLTFPEWLITHVLSDQDAIELSKKKFLFIFKNQQNAYEAQKLLKDKSILFYVPEYSPYEQFIVSESDFSMYLDKINKIQAHDYNFIFTTYRSLFQYLPPQSFFKSQALEIKTGDSFPVQDLKELLGSIGLKENFDSSQNQTFCQKGEIFDIRINSKTIYRIQYFDDEIEHIYSVDPLTFKSDRQNPLDKIEVGTNVNSIFEPELIQNLRSNLPVPKTTFRNKLHARNELFKKLNDQEIPENIHYYLPLFFKDKDTLIEYLKDYELVFENFEMIKGDFSYDYDSLSEDFELTQNDIGNNSLLPSPKFLFSTNDFNPSRSLFINNFEIKNDFGPKISQAIQVESKSLKQFLSLKGQYTKNEFFETLIQKIKENFHSLNKIIFSGPHFAEFKEFFENYQISLSKLAHLSHELPKSFITSLDNNLYLSSSDIFYKKKQRKVSKKKGSVDFFAEQLSSLKEGDFLVHKQFGVGKFLKVTTLSSNLGHDADYLEIEYKDKDKVYVPVYNLDLIQKYADANSNCSVSDLKSKKFNQSKSKARASVKKLAFDIIKLHAERAAFKGFVYSQPGADYIDFEKAFPYDLTPDQASAVDEILSDMCSEKPMDRLICGDVGFGKTEVAMRAAFKAIEDGKQVAVLVPTTILALQHYMNFKERFKDFAVSVDFLSRFKSTKESNNIFEKLENGKIDLIVGTHKILSDKIKYKNLGMVIVDEEHRFGVAQKEKLKLLKANADFLTLSATPIPRTLQLAFLGIKDVSLIQTPPPKRQSISTFMVREDDLTIKNAIEKELRRKGQVFVIHNKVQDIEILVSKIRSLAPGSKIVYAHGQLPEKELEKRIQDFYDKKFDILVATTIVESGIDIPTANTMIINNSHAFGLAQLHQLRGRIGRSDRKAFCYFIIPKHKKLSTGSEKRLEALQRYSDVGSGFALASSDLEIRGAGDILGAEQSGHIQNIGMELYSEMLNEAIQEIKGETHHIQKFNLDVSLSFPSYISKHFIQDQNTRLKYYKKISNSNNSENLELLKDELKDIFGTIPQETLNLFNLIHIRNLFNHLGVTNIKVNEKHITIKFDEQYLKDNPEKQSKVVKYFMSNLTMFKLSPKFSVKIHMQQTNSDIAVKNLQTISSKLLV